MLVAGALSNFDKNAAEAYLANAVGNEVGQLIGQSVGGYLNQKLENLAAGIEQRNYQAMLANAVSDDSYDADYDGDSLMAAPTSDEPLGPDSWLVRDRDLAQIETYAKGDLWLARDMGMPEGPLTVQSGQTLGQIVVDKYGAYDEELILKIAALNGLEDPNLIKPGDQLVLPSVNSEALASIKSSDLDSLRTALRNGFGTETTGERLAFPKFTILGEEEIPGLPDGVQIIPVDAIQDESAAGEGYYHLGKFQKYAYGDNPLLNALKVPANAASNIVNDAIDILNIPVNDVQYIMEHGGGEYIEARLNTEINWLKGAVSALGDLVQYGPREFMNAITDTDWDTVVNVIESPLYAENWEGALELAIGMIFGKNPGKLTDDLVDVASSGRRIASDDFARLTDDFSNNVNSGNFTNWKNDLLDQGYRADTITDIVHHGSLKKGSNIWGDDWGRYYSEISGTDIPGLPSHAHHLVQKGKAGLANQAILNEVGIDPLLSRHNLTWAPLNARGQHGRVPQAQLNALLDDVRGDRAEVISVLQEWATISKER
jgi:hypothetical protein